MNVRFIHWEAQDQNIPLSTWFEVTYWVPQGEQVWIHGTRYEVVRVEHNHYNDISCFVREIN